MALSEHLRGTEQRRAANLRAALGSLQLTSSEPEVNLLHPGSTACDSGYAVNSSQRLSAHSVNLSSNASDWYASGSLICTARPCAELSRQCLSSAVYRWNSSRTDAD